MSCRSLTHLLLATAWLAVATSADAQQPGRGGPSQAALLSPGVVAPPMGLLDLCDRSPEICMGSRREVALRDVQAAVVNARRLAWAGLLTGNLPLNRPASARGPGARSYQTPMRHGRAFLGGLSPELESRAGNDWDRISSINMEVNRVVRAASDMRLYRKPDHWALPRALPRGEFTGDCEDVVLAKRDALIRAGVEVERLSIALAKTPTGQDHAVLLVAGPDGDYVLDNLDGRILHWSQTGLSWQSRQRPGDLLQWIGLTVL